MLCFHHDTEPADLKELNRSVIIWRCWFDDQIDCFPGSHIGFQTLGKCYITKELISQREEISLFENSNTTVMTSYDVMSFIPLFFHTSSFDGVISMYLVCQRAFIIFLTNLLLTEREGRTGEYWPEVVAVRAERSEVRTKTTEGQYSPGRLELARLVSSLLYDTRTMLVLNLPAFENKKYTAYDRFHWNGPYGEIPTKKEPITGLVRVLENLESPGILLCHFPGLESPGKRLLVLESAGNLLNSSKEYEMYCRQQGELKLRSWEWMG